MRDDNTSRLYDLILKGRKVTLKKGDVFQSSDTNLEMSLVQKGYVKRYMIRNDGSISVQSIYGPGYFFPLTIAYKVLYKSDLYDGPEVLHYEALTDAVIYSLDNLTFKEAVEADPMLYRDLLFVSGRRLHSNIQRLENLSLIGYYAQVAHQILYFANMFGTKKGNQVVIDIALTQQDIADVLSTTRETVSLSIKELKNKKLIKRGPRKRLIVLDLKGLETEAYS